MVPSSFPYTPTTLRTTVKLRPWIPFKPHEGHIEVPPLLCKLRTDNGCGIYNISTHVIPAANPSVTPDVPQVKQGEDDHFGVTNEKVLWNCVSRYTKKGKEANVRTERITLFLVHATGFPKETWEPTLCFLSVACGLIDEIWTWESVQHGDSALLNRQNLSGSFYQTDNARDTANFLTNYMPEEVETSALPIQLHRLHASIGESRQKNYFSSRTLVVAGHSFGGCSAALAALHFPALFSSLILVDAMINTYLGLVWEHTQSAVGATLVGREQWPSREDTLRSIKSPRLFYAWHPDMLRLYVDFGLYEDGSGCVILKTPPIHEALILDNPRASRETWESMERLDEDIELLWIIPGTHGQNVPANASNVIISSSGHLIPQECPEELVQILADFLHRKYGVFSRQPKL
ncbi:hypothetical protein EDB19DRAFT_1894483 [Suillus lakei]|nr:hypothetical protein EDB19DRAFT_1894483 [Suillus lakei]